MSTTSTVAAVIDNTPYIVALFDEAEHAWLSDMPSTEGGSNAGPSPTHLLLSSLGACTAITLRMFADRKEWALSGVDVSLQFNPDDPHPAGHNEITRYITLHGDLTVEQRERLLMVANACPIHKVLSGQIRISTALDRQAEPGATLPDTPVAGPGALAHGPASPTFE